MGSRFARPLVMAVALALFTLPAAAQRNAKDGGGLTIPFTAMGSSSGGSAPVTGTFTIDHFASQNGQLVAVGTLAATVAEATGPRTGIVQLAVPVTDISSGAAESGAVIQQVACGILHLELGPLDLDLLGLVVHLDQVVLDISAEPGAGNLLGNQLCAIAGLLDGGSPLTQILNQLVTLLNQLLGAL